MKTIGLFIIISRSPYADAFLKATRSKVALKVSSAENDVTTPSVLDGLKADLLDLADSTERGFVATQEDRQRANGLIEAMSLLNPTAEPLSPFYEDYTYIPGPNLSGKWTLVYTDAPDITGLKSTPTAKLGRIGQECSPPYIRNVIEWKRPDWAENLPWTGNSESRIIQKVCTKAKASPEDPLQLELELAGLELSAGDSLPEDSNGSSSFLDIFQDQGLPMGLLQMNPIALEGPLTAPFGRANVLYLDDNFRILRTQQDFIAVNVRSQPEWF